MRLNEKRRNRVGRGKWGSHGCTPVTYFCSRYHLGQCQHGSENSQFSQYISIRSIRFMLISLLPASRVCNGRRTNIIEPKKYVPASVPPFGVKILERTMTDVALKAFFFLPSNLQQSLRSMKLTLLVNLNFLWCLIGCLRFRNTS